MSKDQWMTLAMTDEIMVAELLLRMNQAHADSTTKTASIMHLNWGTRHPRSRVIMRCNFLEQKKDKDGDSPTRYSPNTPLYWSGGSGEGEPSLSATADGIEDATGQSKPSSPACGSRSKVVSSLESTSITRNRSKKKKIFAELKEEEDLLFKERTYLEKELTSLRDTLKEERASNENLKRMKVDLGLVSANKLAEKKQGEICCRLQRYQSETQMDFLLPDLNAEPFEEDAAFVDLTA